MRAIRFYKIVIHCKFARERQFKAPRPVDEYAGPERGTSASQRSLQPYFRLARYVDRHPAPSAATIRRRGMGAPTAAQTDRISCMFWRQIRAGRWSSREAVPVHRPEPSSISGCWVYRFEFEHPVKRTAGRKQPIQEQFNGEVEGWSLRTIKPDLKATPGMQPGERKQELLLIVTSSNSNGLPVNSVNCRQLAVPPQIRIYF